MRRYPNIFGRRQGHSHDHWGKNQGSGTGGKAVSLFSVYPGAVCILEIPKGLWATVCGVTRVRHDLATKQQKEACAGAGEGALGTLVTPQSVLLVTHPLILGPEEHDLQEAHRWIWRPPHREGGRPRLCVPPSSTRGRQGPAESTEPGACTAAPGLGTPRHKTPSLVAVGFKGRPTPRARLRAGNEASTVTILLKVSLAKCLTTLARALTLSYLPVCLWFAYNMHDLLYLN